MRGAVAAALGLGLLLTGCFSVTRVEQGDAVPAAGPDDPGGPMLVLEMVNRSPRDVDVTYEFLTADGNASGEGMGTFPACEAGTMPFGPVQGAFSVSLDGEVVFEGDVPMATTDGYVILRLAVAEDGDATAANAPRWTAIEPVHRTTRLAGCG